MMKNQTDLNISQAGKKHPWTTLHVFIIGGSLSCILFAGLYGRETQSIKEDFGQQSRERSQALRHMMKTQTVILDSIGTYLEVNKQVSRDSFRDFVTPHLPELPGIELLAWVPRVPAGERADYESRALQDGYEDFSFTEQQQVEMATANPRKEHYPLFYVEPAAGNEYVLGFDLASSSKWLADIEKARDMGTLVAESGTLLRQVPGQSHKLLYFRPVYSSIKITDSPEKRKTQVAGFVLGVFLVSHMCAGALADLETMDIDVALFDHCVPGEEPCLVYSSRSNAGIPGAHRLELLRSCRDSDHISSLIDFGNQSWELVCIPGKNYAGSSRSLFPWLILGTGILGTLLVANIVRRTAIGREKSRRIEDQIVAASRSRNKIHQLIEVMNDGIVLVDGAGKVDWCNKAFLRLLGLQRSNIVGCDLFAILELSDSGTELTRETHPVHTARKHGTCTTGCFQLKHSNKTVEISVQPIRLDQEENLALTARDLTNNHQYEQAILQSHALNAAAHAIVITDRDGLVQWANPAFTKLTGYSLGEVHNQTLRVLKSGRHKEDFYQELWQTIMKGEIWSGQLVNKRKDDSLYLEEQTITPVCDAENKVKYLIAIIQDVTQREAATKKLEDQENSLRKLLAVSADPGLEPHKKITQILELASERLHMEVAVICELEGNTLRTQNCIDPETQIKANIVLKASDSLHLPLQMQETVLCTEMSENLQNHLSTFGRKGQFKAYLGSPIMVDGAPAGTLSFASRGVPMAELGDSEKTFALLVSQWIGGEISKERMTQREMDIAAKIQSTLSAGRVECRLEGLELAALSKASQNVDGDFFDVFEYGEFCTDIVIGDVMGKGVPAALLGAATKNNLLRVLSSMQTNSIVAGLPTPQDILASLHALVTPRLLDLEKFVTLVYARYTFSDKSFEFVDCGHMPILHFTASDKSWQEWKGENTPIGFLAREKYKQKQIKLEVDDILVLYSDGITEARSPGQEMYGPERLKQCIGAIADRPAKEIAAGILESLLGFTREQEYEDDVTCIVLKVTDEHLGSLISKESETIITEPETYRLVRNRFSDFCERVQQPETRLKCQSEVLLAVHEAVTNIHNHAHYGEYGKQIEYVFELFEFGMRISLIYQGNRFSGTMGAEVQNSSLPESGHGLTIISNAVDHSAYRCDNDGLNHTVLTKYFKEGKKECD